MDRGAAGVLNVPLIPTHLVVAASAWVSRIVAAIAQLLVIRALLPFLGSQQYALFSVVTSLVTWFALVEFGVGNSLQNRISVARAEGRERDVAIRSALPLLGILFTISVLVLVLAGPVLQHFLFRRIGNGSSTPVPASAYLLSGIGFVYVVTTLANISYKVFYGEMRGYISNTYITAANVVGLVAVIALRFVDVGAQRLTWSLIAWTTPPALVGLAAAAHVYIKHGLGRARVDWSLTRDLWRRAWRFGGFAAMAAGVLGVDYVVMSQTLAADQIVRYNAASKVYGLIFFLYTALLQATWPVCAEAFGRGDVATVRRMTRESLLAGTAIVALGTAAFAVARNVVIAMLGAPGITLPLGLILTFGAYFLLRVWSDTYAMILMSRDRLRVFWLYIPFQAAISAIGQYLLARRFGVYGILGGLMLSFVCTAVWLLPIEYSRLCRATEARR